MSISEALKEFSENFDKNCQLDIIQDIIDAASSKSAPDTSRLELLDIVVTARTKLEFLSELLDLCSLCRPLIANDSHGKDYASSDEANELDTFMEVTNNDGNTYKTVGATNTKIVDSWEQFVTFIDAEQFVCNFLCLVEVSLIDPTIANDRRIAIAASRAYLLLMTIPGAKACGVFNSTLLEKAFNKFNFLNLLTTHRIRGDKAELEMFVNLNLLMIDIEQLLKFVSLLEYEPVIKTLIQAMTLVIDHYYVGSNKYLLQMYDHSFMIFEHICLPNHGDITDNMFLILNGTKSLNKEIRPKPNVPKPKFELISHWFIEMLKKFPKQTCEILNRFLEAVLTNPLYNSVDQFHIDTCVRYEIAMIIKCNQSSMDFVQTLKTSVDPNIRQNCIEFVGKLLQFNLDCEWSVFRDESLTIPKEIHLLSIIFEKLLDHDANVRVRAIDIYLKVVASGNDKAKQILSELFAGTDETLEMNVNINNMATDKRIHTQTEDLISESNIQSLSYMDDLNYCSTSTRMGSLVNTAFKSTDLSFSSAPSAILVASSVSSPSKAIILSTSLSEKSTIPGIDTLTKYKTNLLEIVQHNLKHQYVKVRCKALQLLECIATYPCINLNDFLKSQEFGDRHLIDKSPKFSREFIVTMEKICQLNMNDFVIMDAYVKILLELANDDDVKVSETVMDNFKRNVLDNIEPYEKTSTAKKLFPWRLLRAMFARKDVPNVKPIFLSWINKKLLTSTILANIETHIGTSNSTEAWILLTMVASECRTRNPEIVMEALFKNLETDTFEVGNSLYHLEVMACWLNYLQISSLSILFDKMMNLLSTGYVKPGKIFRMYEICSMIKRKSEEEKAKASGESDSKISKSTREADIKAKGEAGLLIWRKDLKVKLETYILHHQKSFFNSNNYDNRLVSYLYLYAEIVTNVQDVLHSTISDFLLSYLRFVVTHERNKNTDDAHLVAKINCAQTMLTKMALCNYSISYETIEAIGTLLSVSDWYPVIFTTILCLSDLCSKYTSLVENVLPIMLRKTQHPYHVVRYKVLQIIANLVLDDYLKLRGSILMYMLVGLVDTDDDVCELASNVICNATEKNPVLLRSCLFECIFILNNYSYNKKFDAFFGEKSLDSPLIGDENRTKRQGLYYILIDNIATEYCYTYFQNFFSIFDKLSNEPEMKSAKGCGILNDFIYILAEICIMKEKYKQKSAPKDPSEQNDLSDSEDGEHSKSKAAVRKGAPSVRKKGPTLEQGAAVVEKVIPVIFDFFTKLQEINNTFGKSIDDLCIAICQHFPGLTDFAQPHTFWSKYRDQRRSTSKKSHRTIDASDDSDHSDNSDFIFTPPTGIPVSSKSNVSVAHPESEDDSDRMRRQNCSFRKRQSRIDSFNYSDSNDSVSENVTNTKPVLVECKNIMSHFESDDNSNREHSHKHPNRRRAGNLNYDSDSSDSLSQNVNSSKNGSVRKKKNTSVSHSESDDDSDRICRQARLIRKRRSNDSYF